MKRFVICLAAMLTLPFAGQSQNKILYAEAVATAGSPHEGGDAGSDGASPGERTGVHKIIMSELNIPRSATKTVRKQPAKTAKAPLGGYIAKDIASTGSTYISGMKLFQDASGAYNMANVYALADTVPMSINLEAGTVEIPATKVYSDATYGDVYMCPINNSTMKADPNGKVTGTVDDEGVIRLGAWALIVTEGTYKGYGLNIFTSSTWIPANATMSMTLSDGTVQAYDALVEQPSADEISIHNFGGYNGTVSASLTPEKAVRISPQLMYSNSSASYYCYPYDQTTGKVVLDQPITGTGTANGITFGNWAVSKRNVSIASSIVLNVASTEIKTTLGITYPQKSTVALQGEGTEASPYLISSAADLQMIAQSVSEGTTYAGKYFKQTADISCASLTSAWLPIGDDSYAFSGTYDGNGKTISQLSANRHGFTGTGVFGYIGESGTVKNLKVSTATMQSEASDIGIIAGCNRGAVSNCTVTASTISANSDAAGGIAGSNYGTLTGCSFSGNVENTGNTGGIAGYNEGAVSKSHSDANVSITGLYSDYKHSAGGIVGQSYARQADGNTIADCYFSGKLSDTGGYGISGGVVGNLERGTLQRCFNTGEVSARSDRGDDVHVGGLAGRVIESSVSDCYNSALVYKSGSNKSVAGLIGYICLELKNGEPNRVSTITRCYNSGFVNASGRSVKSGIWGTTFDPNGINPADAMFKDCYNDMQITDLDDGGLYGKETSFLTSGTLPEGFSSDTWVAEKGLYPVLKEFSATIASKLSSASIALANGENMHKVKSQITLNVPSGGQIAWGLNDSASGGYVSQNDNLSISGGTATIKDKYATVTISAYATGNSQMERSYLLAVVPKMFEGEGTEASPYLIKTVDDFKKLQSAVAESHQPHAGDFFRMENDIDFSGSGFNGVSGNTSYTFGGTFDGGNHYIHGLDIKSAVTGSNGTLSKTDSYGYAGLFGACSSKSTVKNLRMAADNKFLFYSNSAPIVGYTAGKVENCRNYADATAANQYVGGVVGTAAQGSKITRCYNSGTIKTDYSGAGGIVGANYGEVSLSQNDGTIGALPVLGYTKTGNQSIAGGVAGANYGAVDRCANNGSVSAYKRVGGLIGSNSNTVSGKVTNCISNGLVECLSDDSSRGAFIGYVVANGDLSDNYFDASVCSYGAAGNASVNGITGLSTAAMTAGTPFSGLNADEWDFKTGAYPVIKAFGSEEAAAALRSIYIAFGEGEFASNVTKNAALSADSNIKWQLAQGKNFAITGGMLSVTVPTEMTVAYDTLTATYGDTRYSKAFRLASVPVIFDGAGTEQSPYLIKTKADMDKLSDFMEQTDAEFNGNYFKLMSDIDYAGEAPKLIATDNVNFQGHFDGNGKTIKGFAYEDTNSKTGKNLGLFVNVGSNATIRDLILDGTMSAYSYAGALAGNLKGTLYNCVNKGTVATAANYAGGLVARAYEGALIENCSNEGTVTTKTTYCGGIAAQADKGATVKGCTNKGTVSATTNYGGGIAGTNNGKITDCRNEGSVSAKAYCGGIAAYGGLNDTIISCRNTADITLENGGYAGGIVGNTATNAKGYIKGCTNTGNITAQQSVGGIAGRLMKGCVVDSCANTGNVTASKSLYYGGLFGSASGDTISYPVIVTNCYNTGKVEGVSTNAGGLIGNCSGVELRDCFNMGEVVQKTAGKSVYAAGGIGGNFGGKAINCWNAGNVTTNGYGCGGFSGIGTATLEGCANFGDVTSTDGLGNAGKAGTVGGIWGYGEIQLSGCYNMGTLTAPDNIGGVAGQLSRKASARNCYNAGRIVNTAETELQCSNLFSLGSSVDMEALVVSGNFYDSSVNKTYPADTLATGVPTQKMFSTSPGEAFACNRAAYPGNMNFKEPAVPNFFASNVEYVEQGDTATNITGTFYVAALDGVSVTSSDNITLANGIATPTETGEAWIKFATEFLGKKFEKTFRLTVVKAASGITLPEDGNGRIVSSEYYDINGIGYSVPQSGKMYILKQVYANGTSSTRKVYVK